MAEGTQSYDSEDILACYPSHDIEPYQFEPMANESSGNILESSSESDSVSGDESHIGYIRPASEW